MASEIQEVKDDYHETVQAVEDFHDRFCAARTAYLRSCPDEAKKIVMVNDVARILGTLDGVLGLIVGLEEAIVEIS